MSVSSFTRKRFEETPSQRIASNSAIISRKAQLYDRGKKILDARKSFSFAVHNERVMDIALMSIGNPTVQQVKKERYRYWYAGKKTENQYFALMDKPISTAKDWNLIALQGDVLIPTWTSKLQLLEIGGNQLKRYLKTIEPYMTRKKLTTESLVLLDYIHNELPKIQDIDSQVLGISNAAIIARLSSLETISAIKISEKNKIAIPYVAFEILGDKTEEILDDTFENEHNRCIFDLIRKMPAVTLRKLLKFSPMDVNKAYDDVTKAMLELKRKNLIFVLKDIVNNDIVITPIWYVGNLVKYKPTVLDSGLLTNALVSCSQFWERCKSLEDIDIQIKMLTDILQKFRTKGGMEMKELAEFDSQYNTTVWSLRNNGVLRLQEESLVLVERNKNILDVILQVLNSAYYADIRQERVSSTPDVKSMLSDVSMSYEEFEAFLEEHISTRDIKKYTALVK